VLGEVFITQAVGGSGDSKGRTICPRKSTMGEARHRMPGRYSSLSTASRSAWALRHWRKRSRIRVIVWRCRILKVYRRGTGAVRLGGPGEQGLAEGGAVERLGAAPSAGDTHGLIPEFMIGKYDPPGASDGKVGGFPGFPGQELQVLSRAFLDSAVGGKFARQFEYLVV